jgi:Fe-S-cluster containining protein
MNKLVLSVEELFNKRYTNAIICSACGGKCCQGLPGMAWPQQFGAPDEEQLRTRLISAFRSGKWAVDCWEGFDGDGKGQFVRPRTTKHKKDTVLDYSWGGTCVFWSPTVGCEMSHGARPLGCRLLMPQDNRRCDYPDLAENAKYAAAKAWEPFHATLTQAIQGVQHADEF